jgi:hypothetical protein
MRDHAPAHVGHGVLVVRGVGVRMDAHRVKVFRALVALTLLASLWTLGAPQRAAADDPEACGYARYSTSTGPTSTVTFTTYCQSPCGGIGVDQPPVSVNGVVSVSGFVCVRHMP